MVWVCFSALQYAKCVYDLIDLFLSLLLSLSGGGGLILISSSFVEETLIQKLVGRIKNAVRYRLAAVGIRNRGQFLGPKRSRDEYVKVTRKIGFQSITDCFVNTNH